MNLLLDTCTFLWVIIKAEELSLRAEKLIADTGNRVFLSPVSSWEISVKYSLGKLPLPEEPKEYIPFQRKQNGIESFPLDEKAVLLHPSLPNHHKDPFDRLLVCQAIAHGLSIMTPDRLIMQYPVPVVW